MPELSDVVDIVREGARKILLPAFGHVQAQRKSDGSLVTQADLDMHSYLQQQLAGRFPEVEFLSEEMTPQQHQALIRTSRPLWVLDPLDGTTNFANGIPIFCVSLGLIVSGVVKLGIIYDPVRDECFTAEQDMPACCNGIEIKKPVVPPTLQQTVAAIDLKRLSLELRARVIDKMPFASQRNFGSGALDWCWLALGRGHIYLHGKQNSWDYIVGQMILQQAHGKCCNLFGAPVFDGELKPNSVVAASTPELFQQWCDWLDVKSASFS